MKTGKIGKINKKALEINIKKYNDRGINSCEINLPGCMFQFGLSIAHRHPRHWYRQFLKSGKILEMLTADNQTILACASCHQKMDNTPGLREDLFSVHRTPE